MKKTLVAVVAFLAAVAAKAVETSIAYQGVLRDDQGAVLAQLQQTIAFRLYTQATGGSAIWGRSLAVLLDSQGLFNVELSDANGGAVDDASNASLADALKSARGGSLYVGLTVEGSSGEISPRQKILSVPYAGYADDVSKANGDFTVAGKATLANVSATSLDVSGKATFAQQATFNNGLSVNGSLSVGNNGTISGYGTIPIGGIILWSGSTVPAGWVLCDGNNGTPNLVDRFVLGSTTANRGGTGGSATATLRQEHMPAHSHLYAGDDQISYISGSGYNAAASVAGTPGGYDARSENSGNGTVYHTSSEGGGQAFSIMPPYYKLAYIMRKQ